VWSRLTAWRGRKGWEKVSLPRLVPPHKITNLTEVREVAWTRRTISAGYLDTNSLSQEMKRKRTALWCDISFLYISNVSLTLFLHFTTIYNSFATISRPTVAMSISLCQRNCYCSMITVHIRYTNIFDDIRITRAACGRRIGELSSLSSTIADCYWWTVQKQRDVPSRVE